MKNNLPALTKDNLPDLIKSVSHNIIPKELRSYVLPALEEFKNEMAEEIGIKNYDIIDKGELPSRLNGNVGGSMTKKMVLFAEAVLAWNYKKKLALGNEEEQAGKTISDGF
ncbi:MAG: Small acid-soluble spore protein alpha/beta type [Desulfotomaculum sp. 46_296]|nr:MAG: Small acid-soluble spore protein alpha/beta type [Desulfotomaculum sp. 46_296]HAU32715.1 acid-soluble spore protein [Desulfotomaculum sp.]